MQSNLTLIGFGVIGVESLHALVKKINKLCFANENEINSEKKRLFQPTPQ